METVIRVVVIYVAILAGLRVLGKRDVGELSPLELITLILIPDLVSQGVVRSDHSLTNSLIAITTLFSLVLIISLFSHRFKRVESLIEGEPTLLVAKGRLLTRNLNRERIAPEEIYSEMHKAGLDKLSCVRWAVLESDGRIAIVPESAP
ncbi:MAG: rane protein [Rariglobus sp.]|jgi:uncharacterized membrane protein YcaP (DUF421 family)|nr:rane protein [Rariglobus sp.]